MKCVIDSMYQPADEICLVTSSGRGAIIFSLSTQAEFKVMLKIDFDLDAL